MLKTISNSSFKLFLLFLAILFVGFGIYHQLQSISLPTDENIFSDPPSRIINLETINGFQNIDDKKRSDSIPEGSLIVAINDVTIVDTNALKVAYANLQGISSVKFFDRGKNIFRSILISKSELLESKFKYLPSAVIIFWVKSGGASQTAGLIPGDIILSINGKEFTNAQEADQLLIKSNPDKPVIYKMLRGTDVIAKEIHLATFNISFEIISRYFISLIFLIFALFIGIKHSDSYPLRLLSLAFLLVSTMMLSVYSRAGGSPIAAKIWVAIVSFSVSFSFGFISHFLFYFPVEQKKLLEKKGLLESIYLLCFLIFVMIFATSISKSYTLATLLSNLAFLPILGYRLILNIIFRSEVITDQRGLGKKLKLYFWLVAFIVLLYFLAQPKYGYLSNIFTFVFYATIALFPFIIFYIFNKYNYFGFSYKIRRNFLYIASRTTLDFLTISLIALLLYILSITTIKFPNLHLAGTRIEVLNRPLPPDKNLRYEKVAIILASLFFILAIVTARRKVNYFLMKKFHRTKFDYKKTANHLSELIVRNINLKELSRNVVHELEQTMLLKKGGLFIFQNDKLCCVEFFHEYDEELLATIINNHTIFFDFLRDMNTFLVIDFLPHIIKNPLKRGHYQYILPINYTGKLIGCLFLGEKLSDTKYTQEDFEFLEIVAKNIAIAIENSFLAEELANQERLKQELEIAQRIQLASLPKEMPQNEKLSFAAVTIPALEVGGDFFDFLQNDDNITIVVGDVSGKGTSAALYMSKIQGILRTLNEFNLPLQDLVVKANDLILKSIEKNYFISAILCQFDIQNSIANLIRAGHLGLYYYSKEKDQVEKILPSGLVMGIFQGERFASTIQCRSIPFQQGDCFIFVTDGVIETLNDHKAFSKEEKLIEVIEQSSSLEPNALVEKILTEVCFDQQNASLFDDVTILVVKPK